MLVNTCRCSAQTPPTPKLTWLRYYCTALHKLCNIYYFISYHFEYLYFSRHFIKVRSFTIVTTPLCTILWDCWFPFENEIALLIVLWPMMLMSSAYLTTEFCWCLVVQSWVYSVNWKGLSTQLWRSALRKRKCDDYLVMEIVHKYGLEQFWGTWIKLGCFHSKDEYNFVVLKSVFILQLPVLIKSKGSSQVSLLKLHMSFR